MCTIGILCAIERELAPFLAKLHPQALPPQAMLTFYRGTVGEHTVILVCSGVCKVNAAIAAQVLIDQFQADILLNSGTAGGLDPSVQLFDTVISEKTAYHDVSSAALTNLHPFLESPCFSSDPRLLSLMRQCSQTLSSPLHFGLTVTGEQFIDAGMQQAIHQRTAALSVDMEGAALAHVCHVNHIPCLLIRSVTDTPAHSGTGDFDRNCEKASLLSCEATLALVRRIPPQGL